MTFIDQTIVAIASPTIAAHLALNRSGTQWVVNAYLLALAAGFALGGRLADVLGARRMAVIGITGFAIASALCGLTPGTGTAAATWIIVFRAVQGAAGAVMIPAALAVVVAAFDVAQRGRAARASTVWARCSPPRAWDCQCSGLSRHRSGAGGPA
jgi:MFS family permease